DAVGRHLRHQPRLHLHQARRRRAHRRQPLAAARPGPGAALSGAAAASRRPSSDRETVSTLRLILHPPRVMKPAVDGCQLVAANSMEIEKVRSFLLQIREKDDAAPLGGIVRAILSPLVVFPKYRPSCLFPHHVRPPQESDRKGYA